MDEKNLGVKEGDDSTSSTDQEENEDQGGEIDSLPSWAQERLRKAEEERENYKQGLLKVKKETKGEKSLSSEKTEEAGEEYPDWDDASKKFQKQTLSEAEKIAKSTAQSLLEKSNEKSAINAFLERHPECSEDDIWQEVVQNYSPKNGKDSTSNISKDLERAYALVRIEKGEFDKLAEEASRKGERVGEAKGFLADLNSSSSQYSRKSSDGGKGEVSEGSKRMAEKFHVDAKKLQDSSNEIKL